MIGSDSDPNTGKEKGGKIKSFNIGNFVVNVKKDLEKKSKKRKFKE